MQMKFKAAALALATSTALLSAGGASAFDRNQLVLAKGQATPSASKSVYIVKLRDEAATTRAQQLSKTTPKKGAQQQQQYDPNSASNRSYISQLKNKHRSVIMATGISEPLYTYAHTFNGFAVTLTAKEVSAVEAHPDVVAVFKDERMPLNTVNTPEFLGLSGPGGLHSSFDGEDVIIGIVDTGINFDHPSFADDGSYSSAASLGWAGACDNSTDATITCNNKLIGAQFFNASAIASNAGVSFASGEHESPRDFDGHGSHVASTAGGNAVPASVLGASAGTAKGMAPRARIASYKACWSFADASRDGCYGGDTMAAIEAATADGVNVINYSIGGSLTTLITGPSLAMMDAANAGIFVATSAGNSGPDAGTVGMPVPWVTNVAASTYTGSTVSSGINVTGGTFDGQSLIADPAGFGPTLADTGDISGDLAVASPLDGCSALTNPAEIAGKIALIQRGACAFSVKVENAEAAGALAVVVFNNQPGQGPIVMGGSSSTGIASVMIGTDDGSTIAADLAGGATVTAGLSAANTASRPSVGNLMADFSSRGPNLAVADLIVPDITAPGVAILAASPVGGNFRYLQGTSMSSPHIAGIAALVKQAHPDWTPAAMRSAMMTTARQNLVKEDGSTPADPFDFGAGHVVPAAAINPGLVFDAGLADYVGFVCGKSDEVGTIESLYGAGICGVLASNGYGPGSNYNHPTIAVSELGSPTFVTRYVTNTSSAASTYTGTLNAPAGINASLYVFNDATGSFEPSNTLTIDPGQTRAFGVAMERTTAPFDVWQFGDVIWQDAAHTVRSALAIKTILPPQIETVGSVTTEATRSTHRVILPVTSNFTGRMYAEGHGMAPAVPEPGTVFQDPDSDYSFNEPELGFHLVEVAPGTKALKFALNTADLPNPAMDLDLYVYACPGFSCSLVGYSANASSDEQVVVINPEALQLAESSAYVVFVHGWSLAGDEFVDYNLDVTQVAGNEGNLVVRSRSNVREGQVTNTYMFMRNLEAGKRYLGGVSYTNDAGEDIGFTLVDVVRP